MNNLPESNKATEQRCSFCPTQSIAKYECPRCFVHYCSIRCYRSKQHNKCSEEFYKNCVREQLEGVQSTGPAVDTFEERMKKYLNGEIDDYPGSTSNEQNMDDEGEIIDSDEEEDPYLKKVLDGTLQDYELNEDDIERQLTALGVGLDDEALLENLTDEEKKAFTQFSQQIHQEEMGLGSSVFKRT